jgi:pimeloyl-ACP methyl ester carboxylesterase
MLLDVPVDGGSLRVCVWGPRPAEPGVPVVLAIHGITASHLAWRTVSRQLPELCVVAPDLRGRGASAHLPGPFGLARHADDMVAVLDALEVPTALVAGHSMGGFVAMVFGHRHRERADGLLLVDGGLPLPVPADMTADQLTEAILGPALARLSMTFPDRAAYAAFWQSHPAFADYWSPEVESYVDYDLTGSEPELRSRVSPDAVREDSLDQLEGTALRAAIAALATEPLTLLRAPLGLRGEPPGLYPEAVMAAHAETMPGLTWHTVPQVNHYTILLGERGAAVVARVVREMIGSPERSAG